MLSPKLHHLLKMRPLDFIRSRANALRVTRANALPLAMAALVTALCLAWALWPSPRTVFAPELPPSIGTENKASILLPRKDCAVAPYSPNTPLLLRVTSITPAENGQFRYQLRFSGLENGTFNLTDYLVTPDGERLREPVEAVTVRSLIPATATYAALELDAPPTKKPTPYFGILILFALAWSACGIFLFREALHSLFRLVFKPRKHVEEETKSEEHPIAPPQTLADLLRPLIEKAALKTITAEEKSRLEQIIFLYWGKFLEIDYLDSVEQLRRILEHPTAGELLKTVEQWLYQPESLITKEEITAALQPYMDLPASLVVGPEAPPAASLEDRPADSVNGKDEDSDSDTDHGDEKPRRRLRQTSLLTTSI